MEGHVPWTFPQPALSRHQARPEHDTYLVSMTLITFKEVEPLSVLMLSLLSGDLQVTQKVLVAQLCPTLCNPVDCSPPRSSVHGILHARILEWVPMAFSRVSSQCRDRTWVSCTADTTREAPVPGQASPLAQLWVASCWAVCPLPVQESLFALRLKFGTTFCFEGNSSSARLCPSVTHALPFSPDHNSSVFSCPLEPARPRLISLYFFNSNFKAR